MGMSEGVRDYKSPIERAIDRANKKRLLYRVSSIFVITATLVVGIVVLGWPVILLLLFMQWAHNLDDLALDYREERDMLKEMAEGNPFFEQINETD